MIIFSHLTKWEHNNIIFEKSLCTWVAEKQIVLYQKPANKDACWNFLNTGYDVISLCTMIYWMPQRNSTHVWYIESDAKSTLFPGKAKILKEDSIVLEDTEFPSSSLCLSPIPTVVSYSPLVPFTINFTITNLKYEEGMSHPGSWKFKATERILQRLVRALCSRRRFYKDGSHKYQLRPYPVRRSHNP